MCIAQHIIFTNALEIYLIFKSSVQIETVENEKVGPHVKAVMNYL